MVLLSGGSWYNDSSSKAMKFIVENPYLYYDLLIDVASFALIGFGFSMTYLRKYGFTALSMTLLIISISIPFSLHDLLSMMNLISDGFFIDEGKISGSQLSHGVVSSIAVLITFGVVLGRINPSQILCLTMLEIIFWTANLYINEIIWGIHDVGFTISVHLFATYFGLAVSWILEPAINDKDKKSMCHSDIFSLFGTMFLVTFLFNYPGTLYIFTSVLNKQWLYWPSFNAYFSTSDYYFRDRSVVNTVLSLCGSTFSSFLMSMLFTKNHKFNILHIQQSTLSGGVAIGAAADLYVHPVGAISIGIIAGIISVFGYVYLSDFIETKLKIADTRNARY